MRTWFDFVTLFRRARRIASREAAEMKLRNTSTPRMRSRCRRPSGSFSLVGKSSKKCAFLQCSSLREKRILIVEYPVLEAPIGVRQMQQSKIFWSRDTVRGSLIGRMLRARTESGGIIMTVGSLTPLQGATPLKECLSINDVRILVLNSSALTLRLSQVRRTLRTISGPTFSTVLS